MTDGDKYPGHGPKTGPEIHTYKKNEIHKLASKLGCSDSVAEIAYTIAIKSNDEVLRGRSTDALVGAVVHIACRIENEAVSLNDVVGETAVSKKQIGRARRAISKEMDMGVPPANARDYLPEYVEQLGLSDRVEDKAEEIIDAAVEDNLLSGKSPSGAAAGAVYAASLVCGEDRAQHEVADAANVSEMTIRNRYQELVLAIDEPE